MEVYASGDFFATLFLATDNPSPRFAVTMLLIRAPRLLLCRFSAIDCAPFFFRIAWLKLMVWRVLAVRSIYVEYIDT